MREASLLAAKFFKELADVFGDEDGHGKYFGKNPGYPRHAQIFLQGKKPPRKNGREKLPKDILSRPLI